MAHVLMKTRGLHGMSSGRMFDKILVANRGEIACRVMRTARRLGVRTVAVYSDADANARHVAEADESYHIGPSAAAQSYLVGEKILEVALKAGAGGIPPGYGFLSENAGFAELCFKNGVEFIGPPTGAIISMGSKSESKNIMEAAKVPCTPGYHGEDQSHERLFAEAKRIGFPVMLKAVMGGGGKGMRVVESEKDLAFGIESCQREALNSFKDSRILIEKYLRKPRHIELQVFADKHGNCVHLNERDCSVQRRHQKVLEESPAPGMPQALRNKMGQAAVACAKAVGYVGAGTVEFMVDASHEMSPDVPFYFMEMNTRLQVEHPVTEMVTGVDLVEWQLRVAVGQELPIKEQSKIPFFGHSIEARVYAENPSSGFLPGSGRIHHLREPQVERETYEYPNTLYSPKLRVETGIREKDAISIFYDPMISKVVVHGPNRLSALRQMDKALGDYRVVGVPTNIQFIKSCLHHPEFAKGGVDTSFIGKHEKELFPGLPTHSQDAKAASLAVLSHALLAASDTPNYPVPVGFRNGAGAPKKLTLELSTEDRSKPRRVEISITSLPSGDSRKGQRIGFTCQVRSLQENGEKATHVETVVVSAKLSQIGDVFDVLVDGEPCRISPVVDTNGDLVLFDASNGLGSLVRHLYRFAHVKTGASKAGAGGPGKAVSPMPGKIVKVFVKDGDNVKEGQPLVIMEAMKMEHVIKAQRDGIVGGISVQAGDQVNADRVLCKVE